MGNSGDQSYKMPTSHCVRLMLITMANDLKEVWIADQPFLLIAYLWQYMPTWAWWITNKFGKKRIENFKSGVVRVIYIFVSFNLKVSKILVSVLKYKILHCVNPS